VHGTEGSTLKRRLQRYVLVAFVMAIAINAGIFAYRPSGLPQLGFLLSLPGVVVSAVVVMARHDGRRGRKLIRIAGLLAVIPTGVFIGHQLRDLDFRLRRLPRYQAVVDEVLRGHILAGDVPTQLAIEKDLAYVGFVRRTTAGIVRAEFFWGSAFPVKHTAYVYTSTGVPGDGAWDHWRYRPLADHWFDASD
jgi:hypothetical protein